ncbi:MAG: ribosome biogenesis GTPase Der [Abditibacteriales bacterium]|nr:ribosome biogenesis GTPase Der [Abditibacteriales bacterium]MDW8366070.1 ribosome biogenesis GTPase Der [Abditibacteriales bacterium]
MAKPIVAIVGKPNVGKSALFNRLTRRRIAVVEDVPGVTRDRLYADADLNGRICSLVDTGGFDPMEKTGLVPQVVQQTKFAINEADVIVFVVDAREEPSALDFAMADLLRVTHKPVVFVANKVDAAKGKPNAHFELGLGAPIFVSAVHGHGVAELEDRINELLPPPGEGDEEEVTEDDGLRIAIVGRPNVGKSAFTNAILGEERCIVSEVPGTTRDAVDTSFTWQGERVTLIDTAGMRRKARVKHALEYYSVLRALRAIDRADVVVLMVDAGGVVEQDAKIGGYAHDAGKPVIIVVNKWDLMEEEIRKGMEEAADQRKARGDKELKRRLRLAQEDFTRIVRAYLPFLDYAPVIFASALKKTGVKEVMDEAFLVAEHSARRVPTSQLNTFLIQVQEQHPPPTVKGKRLKIRYATQPEVKPPTFVLFVNDPELMHFSYARHLENRLRERFGFEGTPLRLKLRASTGKEAREEMM